MKNERLMRTSVSLQTLFGAGVALASLGCEDGNIVLYDNYWSDAPEPISSDLIIGDSINCGCPEGTTPYLDEAVSRGRVPAPDMPVTCDDFRPINTRLDGAQIGYLKLAIDDDQGVGCTEVVISGASFGGIFNAEPNDSGAVTPAEHGPGACPGHEHTNHSADDFHYHFEFDGTRTHQEPTLEFARYGAPFRFASGGISHLNAWVRAAYYDGEDNRLAAASVYVFGPTQWACY